MGTAARMLYAVVFAFAELKSVACPPMLCPAIPTPTVELTSAKGPSVALSACSEAQTMARSCCW